MAISTQFVRPEILAKLRHLELPAHSVYKGDRVPGNGGFGDIFRGSYVPPDHMEVKIAIKVLRFHLSEDIKKLFEKEIYVWSKLDHPNVLPLIGYFWDGTECQYPVLVSEWMDNGSAWSYVLSHPDCDLMHLVTGVAKGLAYIHERGVIHSDIKPDNIVITGSGDACICDFGGSRIVDASMSIAKPSGQLRGTVRYLAYELVLSSDAGPTKASDVWALGMTIFALLTQQYPYMSCTDPQVLMAIFRRELPSLPPSDSGSSRRSEDRILWNICPLCWDHDPEKRADMPSILRDLRNPYNDKDVSRLVGDRDADPSNVNRHRIALQVGDAEPMTDNGAHPLTEKGVLYQSLRILCSRLSFIGISISDTSEIYPYLKLAYESACGLFEGVSIEFSTDKKIVSLIHTMEQTFEVVCHGDKLSLSDKTHNLAQTIIRLLKQTTECCLFVQQHTRPDNTRRILDLASSEKIVKLEQSLVDLKKALYSGNNNVYSVFVSARMSEKVDTLFLHHRLEPIQTDTFNHPHCLPGTRVEAQNQIVEWMLRDTSQNILWLYGVAGSGKSTVSSTIAEYFRGISRLGGVMFFERGKSDPASVIRTLAYALASFDSSIATHVIAAIREFSDISRASAISQFEKLLLEPLTAASTAMQGPIIVILDALDECGTIENRHNLLQLICRGFPKLPKNFRILITSRSEVDISKALSSQPSVRGMELDFSSVASYDDVLRYIDHEMRTVLAKADVEVPPNWPWDTNMTLFRNTAAGLFVWASTAVKLVSVSDDPLGTLDELILYCRSGEPLSRSNMGFGLDELYSSVLHNSGILWNKKSSRDRFAKVLGLLLLSKIPLPITTIDGILGFPAGKSHLILSRLQSLLAYSPDAPIRLFHTSFSDYLMARSDQPWFIDIPAQQSFLATRCFDVMAKLLRFNICNLQTSFVRNENVEGLDGRIKENIPPHLEYVCHFWVEHLRDVTYPAEPCLLNKLSVFAYEHLLYWFEVLSLTKSFNGFASRALYDAVQWSATSNTEISSFLWDAYRLASIYSLPISKSTPHIYLSALTCSKGESIVSKHYSKTHPVIRLHRFGTKQPTPCIKIFDGHTDGVTSVAFSPDGKRVVSGSDDRLIRVWDAESGEIVSGPFKGHTHRVTSVAFSPDGKRIVSGSYDYSIRVWDAESGEVVSGPFEGHTEWVRSVAFSPDGKRVVSGSDDRSIRVWDTESGEVVSDPFIGHTHCVISVAFSPDGKRVVSGSYGRSIRVWDTESGEVVSGPFKGHTNWVTSVSFSPDGKRIVSGSDDCSIRVWDAESGEVVSDPFIGHTGYVSAVAFSPDGKRIISGSYDCSIRVWDTESGEVVSGPFKGHTNWVKSVAFSPDGKRVVSGSDDRSIRVWDAESGEVASDPFIGHTRIVTSVAFSPDGKRIVSGSFDCSIRVWDAESGEIVSGPFKGHTHSVTSIAFSPDGKRVVSGSRDCSIRVWDTESGEVVSDPFIGHTRNVTSVAFSPDGKRVVSGSDDRSIRVWDAESGEAVSDPFIGHTHSVISVAFSPDGKRIVSGSYDCSIRVWDTESGEVVSGPFEGHTEWVRSVAFSPDGKRVVSGSDDRSIRVWDAESGEVVSDPFIGHARNVTSVAFSPDGKRIISGSTDFSIRVWDVESGEVISGPFKGHTNWVTSIAFSPDGKHVVSGLEDGVISISNVNSGNRFCLSPEEFRNWNWDMSEDGWILSKKAELLIWVPPDIRPTLWRANNIAVTSCPFSTRLDFRNCAIGEDWHKGFNLYK